jgi:predicted Rossmann fold flavoprotein
VQFKCDTTYTKTLKGIRVNAAKVTITGDASQTVTGDLIFTEYGVSGDAIFRLSAFLPATGKATLTVDLLPNVSESELYAFLEEKRKNVGGDESELLCGILNNQIARAVFKRCGGGIKDLAAMVKAFTLDITGTLGFDYAQVTKGGVPIDEVTETFESKICPSLFLAGEILDVDGECGGYNLHFAFASASVAAKAIEDKYAKNVKTRGQVCK